MSRYKDHKYSSKVLSKIERNPDNYFLIHYSCESFYDIKDGRTPRVTSIAIKSISTGQVESFSMHKVAEEKGLSISEIVDRYDEIEKCMLKSYFEFLKDNKSKFYLHINMRDINYGFKAIEHRARVLKLKPYILADTQKIDLADLLKKRYGDNYTGHPRMETLCTLNDIKSKGFLNGSEEAKAFENQEYLKLHQSTLAKVEMYSNIVKRAINGTLKTKAKWYEIYGVTIQGISEFCQRTWWIRLIVWFLSMFISGIIGFYISEILSR